jgi:hypothetical protein
MRLSIFRTFLWMLLAASGVVFSAQNGFGRRGFNGTDTFEEQV